MLKGLPCSPEQPAGKQSHTVPGAFSVSQDSVKPWRTFSESWGAVLCNV